MSWSALSMLCTGQVIHTDCESELLEIKAMPGSDWRGEGRPLQTKSGDTDRLSPRGHPSVTNAGKYCDPVNISAPPWVTLWLSSLTRALRWMPSHVPPKSADQKVSQSHHSSNVNYNTLIWVFSPNIFPSPLVDRMWHTWSCPPCVMIMTESCLAKFLASLVTLSWVMHDH